jgi:hypothetical protein
MDSPRSPVRESVRGKKRKRVVQHARCPHCWDRVAVPDDRDPDRMIDAHAKNDCRWVAKHGYFVHPSKMVDKTKEKNEGSESPEG